MIVPPLATSAGSSALVTATTPITLVSYIVRQPVEVGLGDRVRAQRPAGVVDQQVAAVADGCGQRRDVVLAGDVADHGSAVDLLGQRLDPVGAPGRADHLVALGGQPARRRRPDPAARSGHHCHRSGRHPASMAGRRRDLSSAGGPPPAAAAAGAAGGRRLQVPPRLAAALAGDGPR